MILKILKKLIWKIRYKRFCKLNGYNCPDCIYHDFMWEGIVFRGNRCRFPNYVEPPKGESMKQNNEVCIKKKDVVPDVGSVVRCNECMYSRVADPNGLYCAHEEIGKYRPVKNDFFCAYGQSGLSAEKGPEIPNGEEDAE